MNRLKAMFLALGILVSAGITYQIAVLKPGFAVADAVDAGLVPLTVPARLSCRVRLADFAPDGGVCRGALPRYARMGIKARKSKPGAGDFIVFDLPDKWMPCIRVLGTVDEACDLVEDGTCTDPTICAANADPQIEVDACACRPAAGVCTQLDGGPLPFGATIPAGQWTGAACVRKYCGPEIAGEQGLSWPAGCPG